MGEREGTKASRHQVEDPVLRGTECSTSTDSLDASSRTSFGFDQPDEQWLVRLRDAFTADALGRLGSYELLEPVGQGGQGTVYRAQQPGMKRDIALKRLSAGVFATPMMRTRFEREIEAASLLSHPNIVRVYGTESVDSQHVLAMEWIDGVPIDRWAGVKGDAVSPRPVQLILEVFALVCDAVRYAHQRGVLHRDLKPSNILVDAANQPHVLDFGLAKLTQSDAAPSAAMTLTHGSSFLGTPAYASPEQVAGDLHDVDSRSDVYSLGVILYEMLTGALPQGDAKSLAEMFDAIRHRTPARPSAHRAELNREVDAVALKALEKEPQRRYQSVDALALDVRRYLHNETVLAHPPSALYQARKFAHRNKALVAGALTVLLTLVLGIVGTSIGFFRADRQAKEALKQKGIADDRTAESVGAQKAAEVKAYVASIAAAEAALSAGDVKGARESLDNTPEHLRGWEWKHFAHRLDQSGAVMNGHTDAVWVVLTSHDGSLVVTASRDKTIRLWDCATLVERSVIRTGQFVVQLAISPDDSVLASAGNDRIVRLWSTLDGSELGQLPQQPFGVSDLGFDFTGQRLVSCTAEGATIWNVASQPPEAVIRVAAPDDRKALSAAISPDYATITMGVQQGGVLLWDITDANVKLPRLSTRIGEGDVLGVSYSPDGSQLAYSTSVGEVGILDASTLTMMRGLYGHSERVERAVFSPDGRMIAAASWDSTLQTWDANTGKPLRTLLGHRLPVGRCAFSADGMRLYSISADNTLRMWDLSRDDRVALTHPSNRVQWIAADGEAHWVATAYSSKPRLDGLVVWSVAQRRPIASLYQHAGNQTPPCEVIRTAVNPEATRLAGAFCDGTVKVWDAGHLAGLAQAAVDQTAIAVAESLSNLPTVEPLLTLSKKTGGRLTAITFSHDGARIFAAGEGFLHAWDACSGESLTTWALHPAPVSALLADPAGQYLVRGTWDESGGVIQVLDVQTGAVMETLRQAGRTLENLAFSADGRWLASASFDGAVCLWDWPSRTLRATLTGHAAPVVSLAFSPDGSRLASASHDHTIKLWAPETGQLMATLHGHSYLVNCVAFTADGRQLISASADRTVRFWDTERLRGR